MCFPSRPYISPLKTMQKFNQIQYKQALKSIVDEIYPCLQPQFYNSTQALHNSISAKLFAVLMDTDCIIEPPKAKSKSKAQVQLAPSLKQKRTVVAAVKPKNAWILFYRSRNEQLKLTEKVLFFYYT